LIGDAPAAHVDGRRHTAGDNHYAPSHRDPARHDSRTFG
jgi:hypothetical protein